MRFCAHWEINQVKILLKKLASLALAVLIGAALFGCGGNDMGRDQSLKRILEKGEFVVGLDDEYPPMGFVDENGEIVGFDVDLAREVCTRLGVKLVLKSIIWDEKENLLNSGEIDCIWSAMSVTPARAQSMNLSEPYLKNDLIFVVMGDSEIARKNDIRGKTVGVQAGSTTQEEIMASSLYSSVTVVTFDSNIELLETLHTGAVDVALVDSLTAYFFINSRTESYYVLPDYLSEEECAIGFRKGDSALRDRIQQILAEMKADGTLAAISTKWFGSDITTVK
ncbi:MAG: amino acid ABC transporter substrate-binding protein [Clostridia bacterium]|nr:amino acid ABC transporter substrate-binding protein [Clostridia bacterium]